MCGVSHPTLSLSSLPRFPTARSRSLLPSRARARVSLSVHACRSQPRQLSRITSLREAFRNLPAEYPSCPSQRPLHQPRTLVSRQWSNWSKRQTGQIGRVLRESVFRWRLLMPSGTTGQIMTSGKTGQIMVNHGSKPLPQHAGGGDDGPTMVNGQTMVKYWSTDGRTLVKKYRSMLAEVRRRRDCKFVTSSSHRRAIRCRGR